MVKSAPALLALALAAFASAPAARAQDASFGCKVLLCAAATNPSWSGIPYCVPVMTQLFSMLRFGGSWPICSEGRASGLGYEPYLPCPTGQTPYARVETSSEGMVSVGYARDQNGGYCADPAIMERRCDGPDGQTVLCGPTEPPMTRTPRSEPNFVDIATGGGNFRFYFSLRGY